MLEYDVIIIGGGPAGLSAGVYAGRAKLKTLIIEKGSIGGLAYTTRELVNYPGMGLTTGPKLTEAMAEHAKEFGVDFVKDQVIKICLDGEKKFIKTKKSEYTAKTVIIATGSKPKILGIPGEEELRGMGVAYCATCDAEFFEDCHVVVVGSGDQAIEESMYIAKFAEKVTIIVLHEKGILDCNKLSASKACKHPKIDFVWNSTVVEVLGEDEVTGVKLKNIKTGQLEEMECEGVFFFVGLLPQTNFLEGQVELTSRNYVVTNDFMETSVEGVYAAGDLRDKYLRQVVTAANDGAIAAVAAERYIDEIDSFNKDIRETDKETLICFWNPEVQISIDILAVIEQNIIKTKKYNFIKIDTSRRKTLAKKYKIDNLTNEEPIKLLLLDGEKVRHIIPLNIKNVEQLIKKLI